MWLASVTTLQVFKHAFSTSDQTPLHVCPPLRLETDTKSQKYSAGLSDDNGDIYTLYTDR